MKKLIDDQLVIETGIGESSNVGGRKPIILQYNGKAGLSIFPLTSAIITSMLSPYLSRWGRDPIYPKKPITLDEEAIHLYLSGNLHVI